MRSCELRLAEAAFPLSSITGRETRFDVTRQMIWRDARSALKNQVIDAAAPGQRGSYLIKANNPAIDRTPLTLEIRDDSCDHPHPSGWIAKSTFH
jgi:hypothetical protein